MLSQEQCREIAANMYNGIREQARSQERRTAMAIAKMLPDDRAAAVIIVQDALALLGWVAGGVFENDADSD